MLFYPGYQERIRKFLIEDDSYDESLRRNSPWTVPGLMAMSSKDNDALSAIESGEKLLEDPSDEGEIKKYFTFNQTGNIMISSTVPDEQSISPDVKTLFQKVAVFFGALTAAVNSKEKTLYDYDAIGQVINGSGLFVNLHREDRTFNYSSTKVTLDTAIIGAILGGVSAGAGALIVAQQIIERMGSQITIAIEKSDSSKKVAHLMFVCENLMGMPIVTATLFYIEAKEGSFAVDTNCASVSKKTIDFKYHQDTYMFIDPDYIKQFTPDFEENPEYQSLIDRLAEKIA